MRDGIASEATSNAEARRWSCRSCRWRLDCPPLSALLTFGVFLLNVGLNAVQQLYALTRPVATVIRGGRIKNVEMDEIVVGDALVVGPGCSRAVLRMAGIRRNSFLTGYWF